MYTNTCNSVCIGKDDVFGQTIKQDMIIYSYTLSQKHICFMNNCIINGLSRRIDII